MKHTIHIRNLDDETYMTLWNLKKRFKARSWAELLKIIVEIFEEEMEEEWP